MSNVYVVLGMHRTGTSLVSSLLHVGGVEMCRWGCSAGSKYQPQGHFEDNQFKSLNDLILYKAGGDWRSPPKKEKIARDVRVFHNAMSAQIAARAVNRLVWGWKDPRTILTVEHWHFMLTYHKHVPHYIFTTRNKADTVSSLQARSQGSRKTWSKLYDYYTVQLVEWLKVLKQERIPFITISFDELVSGDTTTQVKQLVGFANCTETFSKILKQVVRR